MQVQAITKNVNMSTPEDARNGPRQIQGLPALRAQAILKVVSRKSARLVAKTLDSAIANAEDQARYQKINQFKTENCASIPRWPALPRHQAFHPQGARFRGADS